MTIRINARIDADLSRQLDVLRRRTGQTLTEVIEAALRTWTHEQLKKRPSAAEVFASTGFIGSGAGPRDLARNAKKYLAESLERKA
ncbi:MAG: ribbon-helix-helix domain-containing protein [Myxococcaceae bacterium]|nr:ribbon-helix-helix domain-containing protein [Myxococcaceae bacterium]